MTVVDSHCHLDDPRFDADRDAVIARARAAGVSAMLAVGTGQGPPDLLAGIRLAEAYPFLHASVGVHPHDAAKALPATFDQLRELLRHPEVVAMGEIGLDYHYDFSPREVQREVFRRQVALAVEAAMPVIIHTREAWEDTMAILREQGAGNGVMHCFSGGPEAAREALEHGFHLGFAGVITFPKAEGIREAARLCPDDRLLVETDAPYLAPVPHRGKRNEPAFVLDTLHRLAGLRGADPQRLGEITTANFRRLFAVESRARVN